MQIDIESPAVAAKWLTVLWTVSMWAWLLIEAISALGSDAYAGSGKGLAVAVESGHVVVLWFLVMVPLVGAVVYLKKQEASAESAE